MTRALRRNQSFSRRPCLVALVIFIVCIGFCIILKRDESATKDERSEVVVGRGTGPSSKTKAVDRRVIVTSVKNSKIDLEDLCRAVGSLKWLPDRGSTPLVLFSEKPLTNNHCIYLKRCTERNIDFATESSEQKSFWISQVFTSKSLSKFDTMMRLDPKSCWKGEADLLYLPGLPNVTVDYHAGLDLKLNIEACGSLLDFAKHYIVQNHVIVQNPHLWYEIQFRWRVYEKCLAYQTHFEVIRLDLMRQDSVQLWLQAAMEQDANWDDQLLRSFTVAMFASSVIPPSKKNPTGYSISLGGRRPGSTCRSLPAPLLVE
jgi:hypothetical protein